MNSVESYTEESVIVIELLLLLLAIAVLRVFLAPVSKSLTSVMVLWLVLIAASYVVGEFETTVRINFGLSLKTQAAFALAYIAYSGVHAVWPWCEALTIRFWVGIWLYLNFVAPLFGLLARRLFRQRVLLVTDNHRDRVPLLRWWGFECIETVGIADFANWLKSNVDFCGRIEKYKMIVVDISDYRIEYAVAGVARDYFADFVGVPSFTMFGYLIGPHPRHIAAYSLNTVVRRLKRLIDLLISVIAVIVLSPLFLVVCILIRLDSPGPILYNHRRLGRNMREFWLFKFRTMYKDADTRLQRILESDPELASEFKATFKLKNDPRVTRVGRFLRRFSIDELPQFFNIIAGQMSLVGPRPIVKKEIGYYKDYSLLLFRVLPGATGLWQVSGRSGTSYRQRVEMDTRYVREWTLWWDLKILLKTIPAVLCRRGAY
ncbi:hypothetical protein CH330_08235 [candidate division WOR-3 bacterium JGI_Cruoil_03_51_56]|uniref:Bacterial sugar transferase domain-containing protein n=1 Tax=candidate division WOR-3 bacterium JGI_Cruoil_03_51_56 TaxID=1973747 RepID=A0A235BSQ0_UNCW3|nr:MAG: hypothetical protein CH330_08235 [candidate division WOR-3 bacterium JGI_Cruoil_03_51_56]